jgi:hypothetical protein
MHPAVVDPGFARPRLTCVGYLGGLGFG